MCHEHTHPNTVFELVPVRSTAMVTASSRALWSMDSIRAPEIRLRESSMMRVEVENTLPNEPTSIHWHGLLLPASMDGVPDVSNSPIGPKRAFVYEYPLV